MALSKEDILSAIAEMSVMEVVELIEAMEEKFGVSAAAAVAAAPAAAGGDVAAAVSRTNLTSFSHLSAKRKSTSLRRFALSPVLA